jgi:AcrR family transcriptional regulator
MYPALSEMARARSPEKRKAILDAAVREIAENGLGASTANIARRASLATGSLFTYFATKEQLLNELYLALKEEVSERIAADFPVRGDLKSRLRHVWTRYAAWALDFVEKRKVVMRLGVSDVITPETRTRSLANLAQVDAAFRELSRSAALRGLPAGFAASLMTAFQQALIDTVEKNPARREVLVRKIFELYWRAVR